MLQPHGYIHVEQDGRVTEWDTVQCAHCQRVVPVTAPHANSPGWCGRCGRPVCAPCAAKQVCTPFEARLEQSEARDRLLRSMGI